MKKILIFITFILFFAFFTTGFTSVNNVLAEKKNDLNISSSAALLFDKNTDTIIYEKNSHQRLPMASMTKLASLALVFNEIDKGKISEDEIIKISHHAAETEGSSAFLDEKSEYKISDLIMTVIVCSANDSTVALAEAVSGSEDSFVKKMNSFVKEDLCLKNTNFINATGLPALDHYSTAHDIAKIYGQVCNHSIYKKYSKIWMTKLKHPSGRETDIVNTNRLIKTYDGCDGGKTGFTNDAGYCLVSSATRGDMNLIGVIMGAKDSKIRFNEMANLFNYGFDVYENKIIIDKDNPICEVEIKNSKQNKVQVYSKNDIIKFMEKGQEYNYVLDFKIENVKAPLERFDKVGTLYILNENNIVEFEEDLVVGQKVEEERLKDIMHKIYIKMSKR